MGEGASSWADIQQLLDCLNRLMDGRSSQDVGYAVLVIEHHLDVVKSADDVIGLGPDGSNEGEPSLRRARRRRLRGFQSLIRGGILWGALAGAAA